MNTLNNDKIFTHPHPAWGDVADSEVKMLVEDETTREIFDYELIPSKHQRNNLYQICAIPLVAYELNLGDIVELDSDHFITKIHTRGGRFGYRIAIFSESHNHHEDIINHEKVVNELYRKGYTLELNTHNLIAVDVDDEKKFQNSKNI